MKLTSPAFQNGGDIPVRYTCDGKNISPPLEWSVPNFTGSLALIMDDPDAPVGTWDHWIIFNLPATLTSLPEGVKNFPPGTKFGKNSWDKTEYGGPCPPDKQHRYFFRLYALAHRLDLPNGTTKKEIMEHMKKCRTETWSCVQAEATLIGLYARPGQRRTKS